MYIFESKLWIRNGGGGAADSSRSSLIASRQFNVKILRSFSQTSNELPAGMKGVAEEETGVTQ